MKEEKQSNALSDCKTRAKLEWWDKQRLIFLPKRKARAVLEWRNNIFVGQQSVFVKIGFLIAQLFLFRTDKQIEKYLNLPVLSLFQIAVTVRKQAITMYN
ncbi:hypothetical protein ACS125_07855 [Acinetobacter sp. PFS20]|uniref:hypothetical protein n=1 Tax=Acinetobacter sp. PFS20 TaxID=3458434 RepID=UPI003FD5BF30